MQTRVGIGLAIFLLGFTNTIFTREPNRIQIIQQQKNVDELEIKLSQARPDSHQLRNQLAVIYAGMNNIEAAEKHLQYLVTLDSTDAVALNNLGNVLFMKGNLDSAETLYLTAISFAESKRDRDGIYLNVGLIYAAADLDSEAVFIFGQVMCDSNDYQRVGNLLGIAIEQDDLVKAEKLIPKKKIDALTVKKLVDKARKKKHAGKVKKIKTKKTIGGKGSLPREQIEHIFYWAY
jgi:tetratricopeptide (TPR) repeat protein